MSQMIELKNVSKWYGSFQVLNDCSTAIAKGEVVVVCGPSGSGKSTLIKTINALEPVQKGEIWVDGTAVHDPKTNLPKLRSRVGMVFQHFELFPHLSVTENLTIAQIKVLGRSADDAKARGLKMLDRVGLMAHKDKFPGQLSGGQQQRVAIARALSMDISSWVASVEPPKRFPPASSLPVTTLAAAAAKRSHSTAGLRVGKRSSSSSRFSTNSRVSTISRGILAKLVKTRSGWRDRYSTSP